VTAHRGPIGDARDGEIWLIGEFHGLGGIGLRPLRRGLRKSVVPYSRQERNREHRQDKSA
jgi:hypothetical protein